MYILKIDGTKSALFSLSQAPARHSFTFNLRFFNGLKFKVRLSKTVCGIFHFRFGFNFVKFLFFFKKIHGLISHYNVIISFKINITEKHTILLLYLSLVFKLQQELFKFNDSCVSWSFPKADLVTNFLNLENRSFETSVFANSNF